MTCERKKGQKVRVRKTPLKKRNSCSKCLCVSASASESINGCSRTRKHSDMHTTVREEWKTISRTGDEIVLKNGKRTKRGKAFTCTGFPASLLPHGREDGQISFRRRERIWDKTHHAEKSVFMFWGKGKQVSFIFSLMPLVYHVGIKFDEEGNSSIVVVVACWCTSCQYIYLLTDAAMMEDPRVS